MTKGTRYFMLGSALIVVLGIGTGLVAYYNGDISLLKSRVGPDELVYVPTDATGLAFANVREIMSSEFRQKIRQIIPTGEGKDELFNETGIDLEHDIDSVIAATLGPATNDRPAMVIVRGRFDEGRIETLVRQHGGEVSDYAGKRLLSVQPNGPSLAFVETGLLIIGEQASLKKAIDAQVSHQNVTDNTDLMRFVSELDGAGNTAWAVGGLDALANNPNLPQQVRENLPAVQWVAVSAHVDTGLSGHLRAEARDDKAAENLRAVVNGAIAAARLVGGKDARLDALVSSLQMSGTGKNVDLAFTLPPEVIDAINGVAAAKHLQEQQQQQKH